MGLSFKAIQEPQEEFYSSWVVEDGSQTKAKSILIIQGKDSTGEKESSKYSAENWGGEACNTRSPGGFRGGGKGERQVPQVSDWGEEIASLCTPGNRFYGRLSVIWHVASLSCLSDIEAERSGGSKLELRGKPEVGIQTSGHHRAGRRWSLSLSGNHQRVRRAEMQVPKEGCICGGRKHQKAPCHGPDLDTRGFMEEENKSL